MGNRNQPTAGVGAKINDPAVIGAGVSLGQIVVGDFGFPFQTDRRIDQRLGQVFLIEQGQPFLGIVPPKGNAFGVTLLLNAGAFFKRAAHAGATSQDFRVKIARALAVQFQMVKPVRAGPNPYGALPIFRVNIAFPQISGFVDMAIGINGPCIR